MPLRPEHTINLKGKTFVLLSGLLDLAHQRGLCGIETEVQIELSRPAEEYWVVRATGRFSNDQGGHVFSAYGDASPASSQMRGAYLRHAETRSIARMLRMATNVGLASLEELDEREEREVPAHHAPESRRQEHGSSEDVPVAGCQECGLVLTPAQAKLSENKYGRPLCPEHQRAATPC
jgi:hypothetical protein